MPTVAKATITTGLVLLLAGPASHADNTGEYWEATMKMEMAGMPMAMPAQTMKVCSPKNVKAAENLVPTDSSCKTSGVRQSGNKTSFTVSCTGKNAMTGSGEIEHTADSYRGSMRMTGNMGGRKMDMTQTFSGKRLGGSCDPQAQMQQLPRQPH